MGQCHDVHTRLVSMLSLIVACGDQAPSDPCAIEPMALAGSVEIGIGDPFAPVAEGGEVSVQVGLQGLYMFVVNARVRDLGVAEGGGGIRVSATGSSGQAMALATGCRAREFVDGGDGSLALDGAYFLALLPEFTPTLDGTTITLSFDVVALDGTHASDQRTIIARTPSALTAPARRLDR